MIVYIVYYFGTQDQTIVLGITYCGEDCDYGKYRKQPQVLKPKRITKLDEQFIIVIACNNNTTVLVMKNCLLYVWRDDNFCDTHISMYFNLQY